MGLPCSGMDAVFFHMGSPTWSSRAPISPTQQMSSRKRLLAPRPAGMAKCAGVVDPSCSWAPDVIVCDSQWDLSPLRAAFTAQPAPVSQLQSQPVQLGSRCWQLWAGTNPAP